MTTEELELEVERLPHCWCGALATKLCDRELARAFDPERERGETLVCSRPICDECATTLPGLIFLCGIPGCSVDTVDYCPSHKAISHEFPLVSVFELERLRQKLGGEIV